LTQHCTINQSIKHNEQHPDRHADRHIHRQTYSQCQSNIYIAPIVKGWIWGAGIWVSKRDRQKRKFRRDLRQ